MSARTCGLSGIRSRAPVAQVRLLRVGAGLGITELGAVGVDAGTGAGVLVLAETAFGLPREAAHVGPRTGDLDVGAEGRLPDDCLPVGVGIVVRVPRATEVDGVGPRGRCEPRADEEEAVRVG